MFFIVLDLRLTISARSGGLFFMPFTTLTKHINNALQEELDGESVVAKFATTAKANNRRDWSLILFEDQ